MPELERECAERIRRQYLDQSDHNGVEAHLVGRIAADIAAQCGVTRLKAHRLARGWTVTHAVDAFHAMCRHERIKPRGLTVRSWMEWESGARPSFDYQDLVSRLMQSSPVQLGWAADYSPPAIAGSPGSLPVPAIASAAGAAALPDGAWPGIRRRSLLHLPPDVPDFTGRADMVGRVRRLIVAAEGSMRAAPPVVCLSGQGGTGKTALAVHVAHKVRGDFPDGQLYANLRRADSRPRDPGDVLAALLRELEVDGGDIPEGLGDRACMYRARLAGLRVLVVLDDAADEAQVRPLLPGSGESAVLVTSRSQLTALAGSQCVPVGVLPPGEAAGLLAAIIGAGRAEAEPRAVSEIARLCGCLPLALRIAGARLVSRPAWAISWFAGRLGDESTRLDLLQVGDLEVRASFRLSYDHRPDAEQLVFRMLGLLPADFPAWALAAVLGTDEDDAERLLEKLVDAALVEVAGVDAAGLVRYRLHNLLRDFARELLDDAEDADSIQDRFARLVGQYAGAAELAAAAVHPGPPGSMAPARLLLVADVVRADPWGWLAAEGATLAELVGQAHEAGLWDQAWQLGEALVPIWDWRSDWRDWERTHQLSLDAARHSSDVTAQARIQRSLGALYRELGRYDEAVALLAQAAGIFTAQGDRHRWALATRNLADVYRYQGKFTEAIASFSAALAIFREEQDGRSVAGVLNGMADVYRGLSRWDESSSTFRDCIGIYRGLGDRLEEARARVRYSLVFRDQCLREQAFPLIADGLDVARHLGDRRWEARAMRQLALVHRGDGDALAAIATLSECLVIFRELEDHRGQAVVLRNRGDARRLAGRLDDAAADLTAALATFQGLADRRWAARARMSIGGLCRLRKRWPEARQHLDAALDAFRVIGDRPAEARALREQGLLLRDQGDLEGSSQALNASHEIFAQLGDQLWAARVLAGKASLEESRGSDPGPLAKQAAEICRQHGIAEDSIASVLREW